MSEWTKDDAKFKRLLEEGWKWEDKVIARLREEGVKVRVPERSVRAEYADARKYAGQTDAYIQTASGEMKIEIRSVKIHFTNPHDLPLNRLMITPKRSWDKAEDKPRAIVVISRQTEAILVVSAKSFPRWELKTISDSVRGYDRAVYIAHHPDIKTLDEFVRAVRRLDGQEVPEARPTTPVWHTGTPVKPFTDHRPLDPGDKKQFFTGGWRKAWPRDFQTYEEKKERSNEPPRRTEL